MESFELGCRAFTAAERMGSYAGAAKELSYSVSSISRMVSELEHTVGMQVFEKGRHGVRLTPQGAQLLPHARRLVSELDRFRSMAKEIAEGNAGTVRIGSISSVATEVLPRLMKACMRKHPNVTFELVPGDYRQIQEMLSEGHLDFGTLRTPVGPAFESMPVLEDDLVAVVPCNHALAALDSVGVEDLRTQPFISLERPDLGLSEVAGWFAAADAAVEPAVSIWDDNAAMSMVEEGVGLTVLPRTVTMRANFNVRVLPLAPKAGRRIDLAWRDRESLSPAAKTFLELVEAEGARGDIQSSLTQKIK